MTERRLLLNAMYPTSGSHLAGWKHPDSPANASTDIEYAIRLAQRAEAAGFDALFLADLVGVPDSKPEVLEKVATTNDGFEPITLLAALSAVTTRIGLFATASASYNEPYPLARAFASLDHLSGGRAGWNVVTSLNDSEARNFGLDAHLAHGDRYRRAGEFVDAVRGLWDSFADDAFIRDQVSGVYFDPDGVRWLDHEGEFFRVAGPLNAPRPPQGHPVIAQAGASPAGIELAARVGELIFTSGSDVDAARVAYRTLKDAAARYGRGPDEVLVFPAITPIVAPTRAQAEDEHAAQQARQDPVVTLGDLEYWIGGVDLTRFDLDGPLPELPPSNRSLSAQQQIYAKARTSGLSIRDFAAEFTRGARDAVVGSPTDVADVFEEWFTTGAADGFNVVFSYLPTTLDRFADLVIPELRRRGLVREPVGAVTLRDRLGLRRPERASR